MHDPVIILAPPRSFTSVVCAMLGQHPAMYGLPEVNLFVAETMGERAGVIRQPPWSEHGLLRVVAQLFAGEQTIQTVALARRWLDIRANCTCVAVFQELAGKVGPRILIDKTPRSILRCEYLQRLWRAFPNTRFIHLLRHPRSQGESLWRLAGEYGGIRIGDILMGSIDHGTDPPTKDYQKGWYFMQTNIVTFLEGVPKQQKMRIRGEDLLADPDSHLRQITQWLGLQADAGVIEAMKHPEKSPYACFGPLNARFGNDPNFLRKPVLRNGRAKEQSLEGPLEWRQDDIGFSQEVKELAREFGYE
jgi:hypothetical protein